MEWAILKLFFRDFNLFLTSHSVYVYDDVFIEKKLSTSSSLPPPFSTYVT